MKIGIPVSFCAKCGHSVFPARLLCPRCGASVWAVHEVSSGVVEDTTVLHRAPGGPLPAPVAIGTVVLEGGARVVARLDGYVGVGAAVELQYCDGVPVVEPASTE